MGAPAQYTLREFKITDARDGQSRTIRQFQFAEWPEQGTYLDSSVLFGNNYLILF